MKIAPCFLMTLLICTACGQFCQTQDTLQVRSLYLNRTYELHPRVDDKGGYELDLRPELAATPTTINKDSPEAKLVVMEFLNYLLQDRDLDSHLKMISVERDIQVLETAPHPSLREAS
jgi:hypothetical protein